MMEISLPTKSAQDAIKADTSELLAKSSKNNEEYYFDNLITQTTDNTRLLISLSGKYELLGIMVGNNGSHYSIQIDGDPTRKSIRIPINTLVNLSGLGIKCNKSMVIYSDGSNASQWCFYKLIV